MAELPRARLFRLASFLGGGVAGVEMADAFTSLGSKVVVIEAEPQLIPREEPFAAEQQGAMTVVTSRLTGNFPGSPVDLRYFFKLEGDKIASLEIIP